MKHTLAALAIASLVAGAAAPALAFHEEAGKTVGDVVDQFRGLATQLGQHLRTGPGLGAPGGPPAPTAAVERPLISLMLDHRDELALTPDQASRLEALRQDFTRESIRRDADIRIAEMDLAALLEQPALDMAKVEAKVRELAKLRADLRIERIRTVEQGRALLTPEQRTKLQALLGTGTPARTPRRTTASGTRL
jgi:Spy/CpxP family protein refolding chaperone